MAVETAGDLAAMFATDDFAESASYTPAAGGGAVSVPVILSAPDETLALSGPGIRAPRRRLLVRKADVAAAGKGDVVVVGGETLTAQAARLDETGLVWRVELRS